MSNPVKCAAILVGDKIYTGSSHAEIICGNTECHHTAQSTQGFIDTDGNFLSRRAAYDRAVEHKQIVDDGGVPLLLSEMLRDGATRRNLTW